MAKKKRKETEGWAYLSNATKYHYFRDSRSLCGRWAYLGDSYVYVHDDVQDYDKCKSCSKKRKKEQP